MRKQSACWDIFQCKEEECPAKMAKELNCWLVSGTHCRNEIQGKFLEKMEMCLDCSVFSTNMNVDSMKETLSLVNQQFKTFRNSVDERDNELEAISMDLALGLSESFEMLMMSSFRTSTRSRLRFMPCFRASWI